MKIAVFSTKPYDKEYFNSINTSFGHEIVFFDTALKPKTTDLTKGFEAVCVFVNDKITAEVLDLLHSNGVSLIALRCAGFNNIDLKKAEDLGVKVVRVPAYSPEAVAEHAVALILTLNRKTHKAFNRVRECNFSLDKLVGFNLYQKTVGIIGTGQIGTAFAKIMKGFGCEIIACDLLVSEELIALGVKYVSKEEVFQHSDIISLHCPLTPETHHMIDQKAFDLMKSDAMLINTSRGGLVHTKDVIEALKHKKIGFLGLDVYEQEENIFFNDLSGSIMEDDMIMRLIGFPNVLITSHQAFLTHEALNEIANTTLQNVRDFEMDLPLKNEVKIS